MSSPGTGAGAGGSAEAAGDHREPPEPDGRIEGGTILALVDAEMELAATLLTHIVYNPRSNTCLGSGTVRLAELRSRDVPPATAGWFASGLEVSTVVGGALVLDEGTITTVDETGVRANGRQAARAFMARL